jgi:fructokinase
LAVLCTGEVLWDVFGEKELLGGAPLNFAVTMMRLGHPVALLTAVGDDERGRRALEYIQAHGLPTQWVETIIGARTGTAIVTTDFSGNATYRIQRPAAFDSLKLDGPMLKRIRALNPSWIYFGTLAQSAPGSVATIDAIRRRLPTTKSFYDANLRDGHWNLALVQQLSARAAIMQLNEAEAKTLHCAVSPLKPFSLEHFCKEWREKYEIGMLCVTLGRNGCAIYGSSGFLTFGGFPVDVVDTVGAGDAFAAAFLHGIISRWSLNKTVSFANALGAVVAGRTGAIPDWTFQDVNKVLSSSPVAKQSTKQRKTVSNRSLK